MTIAHINLRVAAIVLFFLISSPASALHKCVDDSGKIRYQQYTCSTDVQAEPSQVELSSARLSKENQSKKGKVKIFELEVNDEQIIYIPLPSDWDVRTTSLNERGVATLRATSASDDGVVFLVTTLQLPEDALLGDRRQLFEKMKSGMPKSFMTKASSRQLASAPLTLELEDGLAHIFSFRDEDLAKTNSLPAGESIYAIAPFALVDNISINATILTNDLKSDSVQKALLGFTLLELRDNEKNDPVPVGFQWAKAPEIKGAFLKPLGWFFKKVSDQNTNAYFVTKENIDELGTFFTGLTVNVIRNSEGATGLDSERFAREYIEDAAENAEVLTPPWSNSMGPFWSRAVLTRNSDKDKGDYNTHRLAISNSLTGTVYLVVFEAPSKEWKVMWKKYGNEILGKLMIDSDI